MALLFGLFLYGLIFEGLFFWDHIYNINLYALHILYDVSFIFQHYRHLCSDTEKAPFFCPHPSTTLTHTRVRLLVGHLKREFRGEHIYRICA